MEKVAADNRKYNSIDLTKFIMAFAVIAIHTEPLINCENTKLLAIYNRFVGMAVPFFFLATGYLLSKKLAFPYRIEDIWIIKNYVIKILKMYLLWTLIYTPIAIYHYIASDTPMIKAVLIYIKGLLLRGEQYNAWPLWYLLSTIYSLLLIIIFIKWRITPNGLLCVSFLATALSIAVSYFVNMECNTPIIILVQKLFVYAITDGRILNGMIYIPIGMHLAHKPLHKLGNIVLFLGSLAVSSVLSNHIATTYLFIGTITGFFGIVEFIKLKDYKIYSFLRHMSTVLYLIHMYVWSFYYKLVYGRKTYGVDCFLATAIISCMIAFAYQKCRIYYRRRQS